MSSLKGMEMEKNDEGHQNTGGLMAGHYGYTYLLIVKKSSTTSAHIQRQNLWLLETILVNLKYITKLKKNKIK